MPAAFYLGSTQNYFFWVSLPKFLDLHHEDNGAEWTGLPPHWNTWEHEAGTLIFLKIYPWKPFCIQELKDSKKYPRINKTVCKELITCWSIAFLYTLIDFKFSFTIFRLISIKPLIILAHSACVLTGAERNTVTRVGLDSGLSLPKHFRFFRYISSCIKWRSWCLQFRVTKNSGISL